MIAGVPHLRRTPRRSTMFLQIGGSNAGGPGVEFDTYGCRARGRGPLLDDQDIVTWSVAVNVSGYI